MHVSRRKGPPVGVVGKLGEGGVTSGVVLVTRPWLKITRIITHISKKNMQITGNHQMARIVRHNDESVREGYIRNGGKEVKLFTSALKAFQCNNRIVMVQRKHLDDFYAVELLDYWNVDVTEVSEELGIAQSFISRLWRNDSKMMVMFSLQSDSRRTLIWGAPGTQYHQENTTERHRYGGAGCLVWGGIIICSRTDLHVQIVTMTGHIYRDVILEQHVR
ncbi:transposable element Tc3 transposase [Trichonephila clavipes]|nr:transposable element Tc3 transposase [Trichonephila clavipes]